MDENNKNIQSRVSSIQNSQMPHSEDKWKKKKRKTGQHSLSRQQCILHVTELYQHYLNVYEHREQQASTNT
jgi:hypothetical protein